MAFTVEDGSGVADANAYVDTTYADEYHSDRGNAAWAALDPAEKETAIVRATDYVDQRFGTVFRGRRLMKQQGLEWPRLDAYDDDDFYLGQIVPRQLQKAIAEYAMRAHIHNVLAPDPARAAPDQDFSTSGTDRDTTVARGEAESESVTVGPITESTSYKSISETLKESDTASTSNLVGGAYIPQYPQADMWLEEIIEVGSGATKLIRGD